MPSGGMVDLHRHSEALVETARLAAVDFLRTELRVANTMLDIASIGTDGEATARRREAARIAYSEVVKHVNGSSINFTQHERDELNTGLDSLTRRFDSDGGSR
jgi:hypothetical protein